jgi:hypothetical protein
MQTLSRFGVTLLALMVAPLLACHNLHPQREPEGSGISAPEPTAGAPKSQTALAPEAAGGALSVGPSDTDKVIRSPIPRSISLRRVLIAPGSRSGSPSGRIRSAWHRTSLGATING